MADFKKKQLGLKLLGAPNMNLNFKGSSVDLISLHAIACPLFFFCEPLDFEWNCSQSSVSLVLISKPDGYPFVELFLPS